MAEEKENLIETFEFTDYNQTLDFNNTNLEQLLCLHDHYESLVRGQIQWSEKLLSQTFFLVNNFRLISLDAFLSMTKFFVGRQRKKILLRCNRASKSGMEFYTTTLKVNILMQKSFEALRKIYFSMRIKNIKLNTRKLAKTNNYFQFPQWLNAFRHMSKWNTNCRSEKFFPISLWFSVFLDEKPAKHATDVHGE